MIKAYLRWLAKRRLISRYAYLREVNVLLEEFITQQVLEGGPADFMDAKRKELVAKQREIADGDKFIQFLKKA